MCAMPRKTKFSAAWLCDEKLDKNGDIINSWCKVIPNDDYSAFCVVCQKAFSIANMGFSQVLSHANSTKHKERMTERNKQCTLMMQQISNDEDSSATIKNLVLSVPKASMWLPQSVKEKAVKAEVLLLLNAIKCNYSFASLGDLIEICGVAFEDSSIVKNMTLSEAKARYVTKFGLAPFFSRQVFQDVGKSLFTIYFDETTTKQGKKQLDIHLSYWSEKCERVITTYCDSAFIGHAGSDKILQIILDFISNNGLNIENCLQCSMDGPNVNLSFIKKFNAHLNLRNLPNLIDVGTCCLHILHTAMKKGLDKLDCDVENLVLLIFQFFNSSAVRKEDFHNIQISLLMDSAAEHMILRHVSSRWLTLGPVCDRIIEQYPALTEYFLNFLPKTSIKLGEKYKKISVYLKDPLTLVYLHFTSFFASSFVPYITLFQSDAPLIHILYPKLNELLRNTMLKFMKNEFVNHKEGASLANINCSDAKLWMLRKSIDIGCGAKNLLGNDADKVEIKRLLMGIRSYVEASEYMQKKLPISKPILQDLQCIHPMLRKEESSKVSLGRLSQHMLKVTKTNATCDSVKTEWLMYMSDDLVNITYADDTDICKYWADISRVKDSAGLTKYPNLLKLVKACLTLSHGNSVPERGFSVNNAIVTSGRASISDICIRSLRICKDYLKRYSNVISVPITKELIQSVQKSHSEYAAHLEQLKEEKRKVELKRKLDIVNEQEREHKRLKKNELNEKLTQLTNQEISMIEEENVAHQLIQEATEKLNISISENNMNGIKLAQMMLGSANENIKNISSKLCVIRGDITKIKKEMK